MKRYRKRPRTLYTWFPEAAPQPANALLLGGGLEQNYSP